MNNQYSEQQITLLKRELEEYKRSKRLLEESSGRLKAIAQTHPKLLSIHELDGTILYLNNVSAGYKLEDVLGKNVFFYIPDEYKPDLRCALEYVKENKAPFFIDLPTIASTGSRVWWAMRIEPIEYDGEVREFLIERTDITTCKSDNYSPAKTGGEDRYKTLFENISNGVAIMQSVDNGNDFLFLDFNRAAEKIDQISRYDVIGRKLLETFSGMQSCGLIKIFKRVWSTGKPEYYPILLYKDNRISNWRQGYAYKLPSGELVHVYSDETKRMNAERTLQLTELSLKHSAIPTYWVLPSARIYHVNIAACKMMGYTYDELTSMTVLDIDPDIDAETWSRIWKKFRQDKYFVSETRHKNKEGTLFSVEVDASYCKLGDEEFCFAFIRDMTERKKTEEEIHKFKLLADNANFGLLICDMKRKILYTNNYFAQLHGYTPDEIIGKDAFILHSKDQRHPFVEISKQLKERLRFSTMEVYHTRKDGSVFPMLMNGTLITDEHGQPQFIGVSAIDITEHKRLEEQLMQTHKLEAIGKLAGGIAHDFNNYLTGILGYSNLLLEKCGHDKKTANAAQTIVKAAQQASELTKQLLGFARKGKKQNIPVNLHDTLNDVIRLVFRTSHKNIRISQNYSSEPVYVMGDPVQLQQVFLNLIINAKDAMPDGGDLKIIVDKKKLSSTYCQSHSDIKPGIYAMVSIKDTGHGIPDELKEVVFEPFFTTKQKGEGSGMGLAVVYGIVKNHSGSIVMESKEGYGTTFTVYMPSSDIAREDRSIEKEALKPVTGSGFIVVVDDDEISLGTITDMLEYLGYVVVSFKNPKDAITFYQHHIDEINVVIVDINMPRMSGKECIESLLKINKNVKTILTSGYDKNGIFQELRTKANVGFAQKPYQLVDLSRTVAEIIRK